MTGSKESGPGTVKLGSFPEVGARLAVGPDTGVDSEEAGLEIRVAFVRSLLHGMCVGVRSAGPAVSFVDRSRIGGRQALRAALLHVGVDPSAIESIGKTARGAPITPSGTAGSISHKGDMAVGLAARDGVWRVGVDIEARTPTRRDISRRVLTPDELEEVDRARDAHQRALAVLLRFSIKEAIYKAIDPFVSRYVRFREVAVFPGEDGRTEVVAALDPAPERALEIQAFWTEEPGFYLCAARARER